MSWIVDHANQIYLVLGIVAAGLVFAWRFDQRLKYLGYALGVLTLIGLLWLISSLVMTDRKQLKINVHAMAKAVLDRDEDELFKHIARDFRYKGMTRRILKNKAWAAIKMHKIVDIGITKFEVHEVSRENKFAKTSFGVSAFEEGLDGPYLFRTEADFVLEDDQWKLKTLRFKRAIVNQDDDFDLPLP